MWPSAYNNGHQIVQTPGYVVLHSEMIHEARVIPLDGRPRPGAAAVVGRRLARPLGRRHAGGGDQNFNGKGWSATQAAAGAAGHSAERGGAYGGTVHAGGREHHSVPSHHR